MKSKSRGASEIGNQQSVVSTLRDSVVRKTIHEITRTNTKEPHSLTTDNQLLTIELHVGKIKARLLLKLNHCSSTELSLSSCCRKCSFQLSGSASVSIARRSKAAFCLSRENSRVISLTLTASLPRSTISI